MSDLFGQEVSIVRNPNAYAAMPGSGPEGRKCKECGSYVRQYSRTRRSFPKCGLVKSTSGKGTDILANSPACRWFTEAPSRPQKRTAPRRCRQDER